MTDELKDQGNVTDKAKEMAGKASDIAKQGLNTAKEKFEAAGGVDGVKAKASEILGQIKEGFHPDPDKSGAKAILSRVKNLWLSGVAGKVAISVTAVAVVVAIPKGNSDSPASSLVDISKNGITILGKYSVGDSMDDAYADAQALDSEMFSIYLPNPDWFELSFATDANPFTTEGQLELALGYREIFKVTSQGYYVTGAEKTRKIGGIEVRTAALLLDGFNPAEIQAELTKAKGMKANEVQYDDVIATFAREKYGIPFELVQKDGFNHYYYRVGDVMMIAAKGTFGSMKEYVISIDGDYGEKFREQVRRKAANDIEEARQQAERAKNRRSNPYTAAVNMRKSVPDNARRTISRSQDDIAKCEEKLKEVERDTKEPTSEGRIDRLREQRAYDKQRERAASLRKRIELNRSQIEEAEADLAAWGPEMEQLKVDYERDCAKIDEECEASIKEIQSKMEEDLKALNDKLAKDDHLPIEWE